MTKWTPKTETVLQNGIEAMINDEKGFVGEEAFIERRTKVFSGFLASWGDDHLRIVNNLTGGENPYRRIKCNEENEIPYKLHEYGLKKILTQRDYCNQQQPFEVEKMASMMLNSAMMLSKEYRQARALQDPTIITQNIALTAPTDKYSDFQNSKPIQNFLNAKIALNRAAGASSNDIVAFMNYDVAQTLIRHPSLVENNKYTKSTIKGITYDDLADAMGVRKVYVGEAQYIAGNVPQNTGYQRIWGNHITFAVVPNGGFNMKKPFGYRMVLEKMPKPVLRTVKKSEPINAVKMMIAEVNGEVISNPNSAYLITDVI